MSWSSRLPSFGGRWSPFTPKPTAGQPIQVQESDYSYISPEDLDQHNPPSSSAHHRPHSQTETDTIVFRHGKSRFPAYFPTSSGSGGGATGQQQQLTVGDIRAVAARKLDVADSRRIRMFHKGKNLKDDRALARAENLTFDTTASSGAPVEILCVIGDAAAVPPAAAGGEKDTNAADEEGSESGGDNGADGLDGDDLAPEGSGGAPVKRKRNRNRKKKNSSKKPASAQQSGNASGTSTPTTPALPSTPLTPLARLDALALTFRTTLLPGCVSFTESPPPDPAKRAFEHKRLTETILSQVLLKLDAVDVEGEEGARGRRRELVREVQGWLNRLDEVVR